MGYQEILLTFNELTLFYSHGGGLSVCLHQAQPPSILANGVVFSFSSLFFMKCIVGNLHPRTAGKQATNATPMKGS